MQLEQQQKKKLLLLVRGDRPKEKWERYSQSKRQHTEEEEKLCEWTKTYPIDVNEQLTHSLSYCCLVCLTDNIDRNGFGTAKRSYACVLHSFFLQKNIILVLPTIFLCVCFFDSVQCFSSVQFALRRRKLLWLDESERRVTFALQHMMDCDFGLKVEIVWLRREGVGGEGSE